MQAETVACQKKIYIYFVKCWKKKDLLFLKFGVSTIF